MVKVLFVCLGNICRSPIAEGVFRDLTEKSGLQEQITCDSCGTSSYHIGEFPDERMQATAKKHDIMLAHRARQIHREDFSKFDYIITMDKSNYQNVLSFKNRVSFNTEPSVMLMRNFDDNKDNLEIPDPYYGSDEDFEEVFEIVKRCSGNLLKFIQEEHLQ